MRTFVAISMAIICFVGTVLIFDAYTDLVDVTNWIEMIIGIAARLTIIVIWFYLLRMLVYNFRLTLRNRREH